MEDFENKIQQILGNPEAMANILSMAKGLGLVSPEAESADESGKQPDAPESQDSPAGQEPLGDLPFSIMELISEANKQDKKQAALFNALKPFLKPGRREKIDRAMKVARISHVASYAIKNLEQK